MTHPTDAAIAQAFRELVAKGYNEIFPCEIEDRARELDATYQPRINSGETDNATPPAQAAESVQVASNPGGILSKQAAEALVPTELEVSAWPEHRTGMIVGTVSGVKVTHTPSAISVVCTAERSMHKNRDRALRCLAAAIAAMRDEK